MFRKRLSALVQVLILFLSMFAWSAAAHAAGEHTINGITVATILPNGQNGSPYSFQIQPTGTGTAAGPYTFQMTGGALPLGLTISPTGLVSGASCEHTNGSHNFDLRITAAGGAVGDFSGQAHFQMNMTSTGGSGNCVITLGDIPTTGTVGITYGATIGAVGGTGSGYVFTLASGSLPAGVAMGASGTLNGTPTTAGTYTFTVLVTDSAGNTGVRTYTVTIGVPPIVVNPPTLPPATNGTPYTANISATGGTGTGYTFAVTAGAPPPGLTLAASGALTGTPTTAGTYGFTVTATDSGGNKGLRAYTLVVQPGAVLTVAPPVLPNGIEDSPYAQTITASGGTGTGYSFVVTAGTLPAGITLAASGALAGTPTTPGTYTFTVKATDSAGNTGTRDYTLLIQPIGAIVISPPTLPDGTILAAYAQTISATGGTGTGYQFTVAAGALPTGLTLAADTGVLSGTASARGTFSFTVQVQDSGAHTATQAYVVKIVGHTLTIDPATLPGGTNGTPYAPQTVTASGGAAPYAYAVTAGTVPPGLTFSAAGVLSGTPTSVGTYGFTVTATDVDGDTGTRAYTVAINAGQVLTVLPTELPFGYWHTPYSATVTAVGGTGTGYTFAITAGALPAGLTMTSGGIISGSPNVTGDFNLTVTATDSAGNTGLRAYTLHIDPGAVLAINPPTLPGGMVNVPYSVTVVASGGVAPYTYAVLGGALPTGLSLNTATGVIGGTPRVTGAFVVTIGAVDSLGNYGNRVYNLAISARPDPSKDREVIGLIDAQFGQANRFAEGQVNNVMRHMESLHSAFDCSIDNQLRVTQDTAGRRLPGQSVGDPNAANGGAVNAGTRAEDTRDKTTCDHGLRLWAAGAIDFDRNGSNRFDSEAITLGLDAKLSDRLILGAGFGLGFSDERVGLNGTHAKGDATTALAYASFNPAGSLYLDALGGFSWVKLDNRRYVTANGNILASKRKGDVGFLSVALTGETRLQEVLLAGYARFDYYDINLDGFSEVGTDPFALTFAKSQQKREVAVLGLRAERDYAQSWGILRPKLRAEYRRRFNGSYDQAIAYSDTPGTLYQLVRASNEADNVALTAGLEALTGGVSISIEYGTSGMSLHTLGGQQVRLMVRTRL